MPAQVKPMNAGNAERRCPRSQRGGVGVSLACSTRSREAPLFRPLTARNARTKLQDEKAGSEAAKAPKAFRLPETRPPDRFTDRPFCGLERRILHASDPWFRLRRVRRLCRAGKALAPVNSCHPKDESDAVLKSATLSDYPIHTRAFLFRILFAPPHGPRSPSWRPSGFPSTGPARPGQKTAPGYDADAFPGRS